MLYNRQDDYFRIAGGSVSYEPGMRVSPSGFGRSGFAGYRYWKILENLIGCSFFLEISWVRSNLYHSFA